MRMMRMPLFSLLDLFGWGIRISRLGWVFCVCLLCLLVGGGAFAETATPQPNPSTKVTPQPNPSTKTAPAPRRKAAKEKQDVSSQKRVEKKSDKRKASSKKVDRAMVLVPSMKTLALKPKKKKKKKRFRHEFEGRIHIISEHTGLDSGFAPEFQYRFRMDRWLDLRAGIRVAPPGFGDALRYYLSGFVHVPLPLVRDGALGVMVMHNSYGDIQKGENTFFFLHHFDMRYFAFDGGLVLRSELVHPSTFRNPFLFSTEYLEVFYVYDMRVKIDFTFPKLGGSVLQIGAGLMNFLDNDVQGPATGGYRFFASWDQPNVGRFEVMGGLMSYGFWAFAGYYGRWFLRFSYTYTLDI
ncbi:MAG: hypothetical protein H6728_06485 [Myxococcales bacterium]|nr:hypothetical protein [Myxococcales bacterium]MCB9642707.1 hypothetical protein [Myxococcales bacterium]